MTQRRLRFRVQEWRSLRKWLRRPWPTPWHLTAAPALRRRLLALPQRLGGCLCPLCRRLPLPERTARSCLLKQSGWYRRRGSCLRCLPTERRLSGDGTVTRSSLAVQEPRA